LIARSPSRVMRRSLQRWGPSSCGPPCKRFRGPHTTAGAHRFRNFPRTASRFAIALGTFSNSRRTKPSSRRRLAAATICPSRPAPQLTRKYLSGCAATSSRWSRRKAHSAKRSCILPPAAMWGNRSVPLTIIDFAGSAGKIPIRIVAAEGELIGLEREYQITAKHGSVRLTTLLCDEFDDEYGSSDSESDGWWVV
jgi:hypothetical protein